MPLASKRVKGGRNKNLILFILKKAISGALNIKGTSQLPNPPNMVGITIKKIKNKGISCNYNIVDLIITIKSAGLS